MSTDPTDPLEAARRTNRALAERVAELERQLKRFAEGDQAGAPLGGTLSERAALLSEAERIVHCGSWVWDVETNDVLWSDELYRIFGCDPATDRASAELFFARVHPEDRQRVQEASARSVASGVNESVDCRVLRRDGSVRHVKTDGAFLFDAAGSLKRAVGAVLDVTEAREAAQALRLTAERFAEAQRIGRMGSFDYDVKAGRAVWSEEFYRVVDVDPSQAPAIETFLERVHEEDRPRIERLIERSQRSGETQPSRARLVYRDGSIHHVDMMAVTTFDEDGSPATIRGTVTDVTELVKLEAAFHQSQKMEAVGQLAGGLAHDYNNLLTVIRANAELLLDRQESPELREIMSAAASGARLAERLLTFSRQSSQRARVAQLRDDLEEAKGLIQRALGESVVLCYDFDAELWPVFVDRGQVQQVVLNLALNSRDAMPDGGTFTLLARNQFLDGVNAELRHERPGEYVTLAVMDTGTGMDEATRARVFEPFFTTKPAGRGTGLGLAMVFGAMKQLGGFVEVRSQLRSGTTFTLWFPRAASEPTRSRRPQSAAPRAPARLLLVEDNPAVANVARRILQSAGHQVRVSGDPHEALRMWKEDPADVLVTDVEMPGMSGVQLRERLYADTPELRTLFVTGHSTEHLDIDAHEGRSAIVLKPFSREELLAALARLLRAG